MAATYTYTGLSGTIEFDFTNEKANVSSGYDSLEIQELYDAAREAEDSDVGFGFPKIVDGDGKAGIDPVNGISTCITVALQEGWVVNTMKTSGKFTIYGGNLIRHDGTDVFEPNASVSQILINIVGGMIVTTSGDGFGTSDRTMLSDCKKILRSDQRHTQTKVYLKEEGTENVLVEKTVTGSNLDADDDIKFTKAT